jgi:imidazolonepropionase-like amidohydrolase
VFTGGLLFDGESFVEGTLVVKGRTIQKLLRGQVTIKAGKVIDIKGKTLLPGLFDLHVHTPTSGGPYGFNASEPQVEPHLKSFLRAGVTSVLDLGSPSRLIFAYRKRIQEGKLLGPNFFAVGPLVTTSGGHPCRKGSPIGDSCLLLDTPADVSKLTKQLYPYKPDMIKIVIEDGGSWGKLPRMTKDTLQEAMKSIRKKGYSVIAHVSKPKDIEDALDAGVKVFGHIPMHGLMSQKLLERMVREKAVIVPTLIVTENLYLLSHSKYEIDKRNLQEEVPASVLAVFKDPRYLAGIQTPGYQATIKKGRDTTIANFKACLKAGVLLATGSDAGNPGTFHGPGLHDEILLFHKFGMTPAQALKAATLTAAQTLKLTDRGSLVAGAIADLVIVNGDLRTNLAAIRKVERVFLAGVDVQREKLALSQKTSIVKVAVTDQEKGATCLFPTECKAALICDPYNSLCTEVCQPQTPTSCPKKKMCYQTAPQSSKGFCVSGTSCDPLQQDCPNGTACIWLGNGTTTCWNAGAGKDGAACGGNQFCAKGYQCNYNSGKCYKLCNPKDPKAILCDSQFQSCNDLSQYAGFSVGGCF